MIGKTVREWLAINRDYTNNFGQGGSGTVVGVNA